jgi:hypothetical protein
VSNPSFESLSYGIGAQNMATKFFFDWTRTNTTDVTFADQYSTARVVASPSYYMTNDSECLLFTPRYALNFAFSVRPEEVTSGTLTQVTLSNAPMVLATNLHVIGTNADSGGYGVFSFSDDGAFNVPNAMMSAGLGYYIRQSTPPLWPFNAPIEGGDCALVNSNGHIYMIMSKPGSTAWTKTNLIAAP